MMKTTRLQALLSLFLCTTILLGCGLTAPKEAPAPTPEIEATAQAAIAATTAANQALQSTAEAMAAATVQAAPAQPTYTPYPTLPAPTAIPQEDYYTLSEEELQAMIDAAVAEALAASDEAAAAAVQAAEDGNISEEEAQEVYVYSAYAEEYLAEIDAMIQAYYDIYGELAEEALVLLEETEQILDEINTSLAAITGIMEQGAEAATQALEQLNQATQAAQEKAGEARDKASAWKEGFQASLEGREQGILNAQPDKVPANRKEMIQALQEYAGALQGVLGKKSFSKGDLEQLGKLGANAIAGLKGFGGPQLSGLAGTIEGLNRQVARGQVPQARGGFDGFQRSLPGK